LIAYLVGQARARPKGAMNSIKALQQNGHAMTVPCDTTFSPS
jgi:hypothetical protein